MNTGSFVCLLLGVILVADARRLLGGHFRRYCPGDRVDGRRLTLPQLKVNNCRSRKYKCRFSNDPHQVINGRWRNEAQKAGYSWLAYHMDRKTPIRVQGYFSHGNRHWTTFGGFAIHLPNGKYVKVVRNKLFVNCRPVHRHHARRYGLINRGSTWRLRIGRTTIFYRFGFFRITGDACTFRRSHGWCSAPWQRKFQSCLFSRYGLNPAFVKGKYNYFGCKNKHQDLLDLRLKLEREKKRKQKLEEKRKTQIRIRIIKEMRIKIQKLIQVIHVIKRTQREKKEEDRKPKQRFCSRKEQLINTRRCIEALGVFSGRKCPKGRFIRMCKADLCGNKRSTHTRLLWITRRNYLVKYKNRKCTKTFGIRRCRNKRLVLRMCVGSLKRYDGIKCPKAHFYRTCMKYACKGSARKIASIARKVRLTYLRTYKGNCKASNKVRDDRKVTQKIIKDIRSTRVTLLRRVHHLVRKVHHSRRVIHHHRRLIHHHRRFHHIYRAKYHRLQRKYRHEISQMKREIRMTKSMLAMKGKQQKVGPIDIKIDNSKGKGKNCANRAKLAALHRWGRRLSLKERRLAMAERRLAFQMRRRRLMMLRKIRAHRHIRVIHHIRYQFQKTYRKWNKLCVPKKRLQPKRK